MVEIPAELGEVSLSNEKFVGRCRKKSGCLRDGEPKTVRNACSGGSIIVVAWRRILDGPISGSRASRTPGGTTWKIRRRNSRRPSITVKTGDDKSRETVSSSAERIVDGPSACPFRSGRCGSCIAPTLGNVGA